MADDQSGVAKPDKEPTETEDEKVSISYNHQLASTSRLSVGDAETYGKEGSTKVQQAVFHRSISCDAVVPSTTDPVESPSKTFEAPFGIDRIAPPTGAKRARGRPRKEFTRPPKHHLTQNVSAKTMRGRGRPRRDDILHHKIFPGRPRFRGKKFPYFPLAHPSQKIQDAQLNKDLYEDVNTSLKAGAALQEKILTSANALPDNELKIEHFCALCNLSETSVLGQGKLTHFKPSEDFNCFESMEQKSKSMEKTVEVSTESGSELKLFFRKQKALESNSEQIKIQRSKSLQGFPGKPSIISDVFQELEATGFKSPPGSNDIFEPSGELYTHFNCAAWSEGVSKTFEKKLFNVDKAVVQAAFQRCSKCDKYGASVKCCFSECTKIYHYPCAIVSGALQNANCFKIICSVHREHAFSFGVLCMACHESGDLSQLLLCTTCANYYHGNCLEPPITPSPDVRAGWQCFDCKVCQNCRLPEESNKMLVCNTCDKGYHIFCVKPPVSSIPKSGWKCSACRMCGDCGARTPGNGPSSRWHLNYSVCDSCYQQRNKGVACPLCGKAYRQCSQRKAMRHCTICQKYIHPECDRRTGMNSMNYVCPICTSAEDKHLDENYVEHHIKDTYQGSSRDSFLSGNEDTLSSDESEGYIEAPNKVSSRRTSSEQQQKRKKRPSKRKLKAYALPEDIDYPMTAFLPKEYKTEDDDPTDDNKMILASATDEFVLCQDLCVMCGSFGKGEEGRLIACAQCGQCYHSYCASIKVTTVVLKKGWRCLDCTVCEGCGQPHDESRLLLCDECDISFHTYCLNPPLPDVPPGNWKCKWCVMCTKCGSKSPGLNCEWQVNYTLCGPCASFTVCCLCLQLYIENDLIINCNRCERWLHGMCDQIENEEQAEKCAEYGYTCPLCRPPDELPPHLLPAPPSPPTPEEIPEKHASPIAKVKEPEPPVVKAKPPVQYHCDGVYLSESGMKYMKTLLPEQPKKIPRPRKLKQGLLGLLGSQEPGKSLSLLQLDKGEDSASAAGIEEPSTESTNPGELGLKAYDFEDGKMVMDGTKDLITDSSGEKKKRPRKLQKLGIGGFSVKPRGRCSISSKEVGEPVEAPIPQPTDSAFPLTSDTPILATDDCSSVDKLKKKPKRKPKKKTFLDESFPSYLRDAFFGKELLLSCKKLGKTTEMRESQDSILENSSGQGKSSEEQLKNNQTSMQTIGTSADSKSLEAKDLLQTTGASTKTLSDPNAAYKRIIKSEIESIKEEHLSSASALNDLSGGASGPGMLKTTAYVLQQGASSGLNPSSIHPNLLQNLQHADSNSSWPDSDCDPPQLQKNIMKWESDERLGLLSTISPVLYANINLPHLKIEFPAWTDRVKQIAKIWRGLPTEKRQPYLQRARENRAASRSQRSSSTDSERSVKETSKTQEVDQEKQWKQYHAIRMQHQAAQQRLIHEQRVRAALKAQTEKTENSPAVSGENIKLFHSKSLSDIPQFPSTLVSEESMQNSGKAKVFEKRWSSSAIDLNATETLLQGNKLIPENQAVLQKSLMQERIASSLLHVSKVQSPINSPISAVSDAAVSPSAVLKTPESFQPAQSPVHTTGLVVSQKQAFSSQVNPRTAVLMNRPEATRVTTPTVQKEAVNTPPSTPRPHSSESFFQMSASPQSQLIASLDTHSQPTPARSKLVGPGNLFEGTPAGSSSPVIEVQNPAMLVQSNKAAASVSLGMTLQTTTSKPQIQQPVMMPVEQFVLQQASNFPASNIVKQLSQYKETFSPMTNTPEMGPMLPPEKSLEHQNLEQLLQTSQITLPFQNKVTSHQHLRDLLQNKKAGESELPSTQEGKLISNEQSTQDHLTSPGQLKLSDVLQDPPIETICSPGKLKLSDVLRDPPVETTSPPRKLKLSDVLRDPPIETTSSSGKLKLSDVLRNPPIETTSSPGKLKLSDVLRDPPIETPSSSGKLKLSDVLRDPPIAAESTDQTFSPQQSSEKLDILSSSDPQTSALAESQFGIEDNCISSQADAESGSGKKKTTAADLVKDLETQQHDDAVVAGCNLDILPGDVGDLELDDDELLGLGNDFNILEYADPELDKSLVGEGEKSNILDEHLDLDDKDEELEDDVIKDDGTQDKDLIVQEIADEKKTMDIEKQDDDINQSKTSDLPESFLNFDKKDLDTLDVDNSFKPKDIANPSMTPMANIIKEEPKQAFSSCSLSSQSFSPTIDIKLEKGIADNCSIQKPPNITFNPETQTLTSQRPGIQVPEQLIPPPSYRMVTALKQTLGGHVPQNALPPQNKGVFPLHLNMNLRQDLPLNQPNVLSSPVPNTKPLLLQEQPLLLEDLVEQEKREQRRQNQESLISPHAADALLSDIDFERLKDDVFSGPPDDSLGGPGSLLGGHDPTLQAVSSVGVPSSSNSHQFGPPPYSLLWQNQESVQLSSRPLTIIQNLKAKAPVSAVIGSVGSIPGAGVPAKAPSLQGSLAATRPFNPNFVPGPENLPVDTLVDPEKLKLINYEKYLMQQHALLGSRQKYFETEVMKLRKAKKALNAKQRQLRKNGSELAENDALELARVSQEQAGLQKQLEQARKQFRQNTVAVQDYRLKQQKRQQQQLPQQQQQQQQQQQAVQTVPRSPLHTSVSSLQSSPQNSQSPLQFTQTAPQSPMMPASPVGPPNSVRIQHSPSPLMQSPVSVTSAVAQQTNVHSPLLSQQLPLQFQTAKSEGKTWPPNVKIQQGDNIPTNERFSKRESFEANLTSQTYQVSSAANSPLADINLKGLVEMKKSQSDDSLVKKIDSPSLSMNLSDDSFVGKPGDLDIGQTQTLLHKDQKLDVESAADSAVPQSILSQSLPSSVSNTLKFTLRQTGMPTGCLPATDGASDNPSELAFSSPTPEIQSKISEPKPMLISAEKKLENKDSQNIEATTKASVNESSLKIVKSGLTSTANESLLDNQAKSSTATVGSESNLTSERTQENGNKTDQGAAEKNLQQSLLRADVLANIKQEIIEDVPVSTSQVESADIKIEPGTTANQTDGSVNQAKSQDANEGSSDEELENITKSSAEKEREQAEQNVLLKQLLQNCPSADTPRKSDSSLIDLPKGDDELSRLEVNFDINNLQDKNLLGDAKSKKPSYLDIRRAQLDKDPTPPPGEKEKPLKRKRPKKKKLEPQGKPDGVVVKKKCRRSSSKLEDNFDPYVETLNYKITNLPQLRIIEPNIQPNYTAIPVSGAGDMNVKDHQLKGRYGRATIPGQSDIYSCSPYTKETPASTAILPPSSPPYRGFYNQEFPGMNKAIENNELSLIMKSNIEKESCNVFRDPGSPDTVISSSSPESCLLEPKSKFPMLVFIDHLLPEKKRNTSPVIPLMYPIPIRLQPKSWNDSIMEIDEEKDKENIPDDKPEIGLLKTKMSGIGGYSAPLKDSGNVAVTLTLSSAAAEDICGVLSALADLLKIPIPASYEIVERTATPPSQKLGLYRRSKNSDVSIHSLLNGKPRFCRHCDIVVLSAGIRKKIADLPYMSKEEQDEDEVIFCSTNCYMQFALTHRSTAVMEEKGAAAVVDHIGDALYDKTIMNTDDSLGGFMADDKDLLKGIAEDIKPETLDLLKLESMDIDENESNDLRIDLDAKNNNNNSSMNPEFSMDLTEKMEVCEEMQETAFKKWRSIKYKYWYPGAENNIRSKRKDESSEKPARPFYHTIKPSQMPKDERKCILCHGVGDGETNGAARLLNVDVNKWVHLNCALWSAEVYETVNGALMNVETAIKRSKHLNCCLCHKQGASVRCFKTRCPSVYHFPCARKEQCSFFKDKTVLCPQHAHRGNSENKLDSVAVLRRVYINREEHKQVASMIQDEKYVLRIGSLIFLNIGQLLPSQMPAFHNANCIYPVGYKVIRMYWSMRKLGRRSQYTCTINEVSGKPEFCIHVKEVDQKELELKDKSAKAVWQKVIYPIEKMRRQAKTIKIFPDFISGDDLFGLTEPAILRIIESLPGVDTLNDYNFRYGRSPFLELPLAINPTGCARSEPKLRTHFKRPHTLHTCNTSRPISYHSPFAGMEVSSPYIKQFVHSKSSQYRKMKTEWRNNVYLARSRIQGLGLYAARDLEKHTMVIEYIGQLIRNEISERNEAVYDAQNRGVYMFRLDENHVIDATLCGGLARYINHSCNPNCVAEVVQIDRVNKILIITNRRISRGEELSYDYKFEVEDDQHKIPCLCGAPNCRKWMN
ncbi:histone-lysine N-methyltransferase 2C-like isoform X4 [Argiope bruennichi]|uniref:histone-lysine N-methyltransferase 2C-like isoform X4 n=1 Tax=Argiope bruennichi TaxID=94029 RepID=UPI0024947DF1|nr:histone-lysine N-methyltransferase 2C-like isoform X4 [Argiope bruennichi]